MKDHAAVDMQCIQAGPTIRSGVVLHTVEAHHVECAERFTTLRQPLVTKKRCES